MFLLRRLVVRYCIFRRSHVVQIVLYKETMNRSITSFIQIPTRINEIQDLYTIRGDMRRETEKKTDVIENRAIIGVNLSLSALYRRRIINTRIR